MVKNPFKAEATEEMKRHFGKIWMPPCQIFRRREIPILILKRIGILLDEFESVGDPTIYNGLSGIAYTLLCCSCHPLFDPIKKNLLEEAKKYVDASLEYCKNHDLPPVSLLMGKAGIYAVAAVVYKMLGLENEAEESLNLFSGQGAHCLLLESKYEVDDGGDDFCNGRAGYIAAALWLKNYFPEKFSPKFFYQHLEVLIESCREYSQKLISFCSLAYSYYEKEYIGMMHGFGGILFIILCFSSYLDEHPELDEEVKLCVDMILLRQKPDGTFYTKMNNDYVIPREILKWRSGASGLLHLMAKAYLRWNHSRYYYSCLLIGDLIWKYGLEFILNDNQSGGHGLDHGFVGNLYGLLILYRLTRHTIYLQQAHACSVVLKNEKFYMESEELDFSLFNGLAGSVLFLLDLINIDKVYFPFLPLYSKFDY